MQYSPKKNTRVNAFDIYFLLPVPVIANIHSVFIRNIFDAVVFSPERLDFVAGAACVDCVQKLPDPVYRVGLEVIN